MSERVVSFEAEREKKRGAKVAPTPDRAPDRMSPRREPGERLPRRLLLLGLLLLGALAALFSTSRRSKFERSWEDWGDDVEPFEPVPPARPEPVPSVEHEIRGPAGMLHVDDGGPADSPLLPVLFVHGLGGSSAHWRAQLAALRPHRRAIALDLRGHGRSVRSKGGGYGISDYASDVAVVADELELGRFVLAGHSLGGLVAIEYAGRHQDRVAGLLLADPNGDMTKIPREEMAPFLAALQEDPQGEMRWHFQQILVGGEPAAADQVLADLAATDPEALKVSLRSASSYAPLKALGRYEGPKLSVISHMNDLPYSLHNLAELPHQVILGTGHWLMMDRPEAFDRLMEDFLARIE